MQVKEVLKEFNIDLSRLKEILSKPNIKMSDSITQYDYMVVKFRAENGFQIRPAAKNFGLAKWNQNRKRSNKLTKKLAHSNKPIFSEKGTVSTPFGGMPDWKRKKKPR